MTCFKLFVCLVLVAVVNGLKTHGGNANGADCVFPFVYRGKTYTECTRASYNGLWSAKWCATVKNYDKARKWGLCPKKTTTEKPKTTKKTTQKPKPTKKTPKVCKKNHCPIKIKGFVPILVGNTCYTFVGTDNYNAANTKCKKFKTTLATLKQGSKALKAVSAAAWKVKGWNNAGGFIRLNGKQGNKCSTLRGSTKYTKVEYLSKYCTLGAVTVCEYKSDTKPVPCKKRNVCKLKVKGFVPTLVGNTCYTFVGTDNYNVANKKCKKVGTNGVATLKTGSKAVKAIAAAAWKVKGWNNNGGFIRLNGKDGKKCATLLGTTKYTKVEYKEKYCTLGAVTVCEYKSEIEHV